MQLHTVRAGAVERAAYVFYLIAALGSSIGQIWVGVTTAPWPQDLPVGWRIAIVAPFALVIDLGGVVTSAFADSRQRLGETAAGWRVLSAMSMIVGVGINVIGHRDTPYLAVVFGGLGSFAYTVWLLHSAARRRDALRAAGVMATTAPVYGIARWVRSYTLTRLARDLALQHGYGLFASLDAARQHLRDQTRNAALLAQVKRYVTEQHADPILASIAVTGIDTDALAAKIRTGIDVDALAATILTHLNPAPPAQQPTASPAVSGPLPTVPVDVLRTVPTKQDEYDRWRALWTQIRTEPAKTSSRVLADRLGIGLRTIQRIRAIGPTGLLEDRIPPAIRLAALASQAQSTSLNGHKPGELALTAV
jgi:hypothetical protein